jgi:hypothetical protein
MEGKERGKDISYFQKTKYNERVRLKRRRFLHTYCPKCGASLIKGDNIQLKAVTKEGKEEILELSVYLNIFAHQYMHEIIKHPKSEIKDLKCPHCAGSIAHPDVPCEACAGLTAELSVAAMNKRVPFLICLKEECRWHGITPEDEFVLIQESSREW